ncbi:MAG: hypothetical protein IJ806_11425 [Ruminococcus sp.]|nr:hypothetical protein [Ruminococcus sp.]
MKNIYIVISQTSTKFGRAIRNVWNMKYNHTAIVLDDDFSQWYSFARRHHSAVLTGGLVKENIQRYTLNQDRSIASAVFCIKLSDKKYEELERSIRKIACDGEYMYNLLSVLTYPVTKGLKTYKAFTCAEFVVYLLSNAGFGKMFDEKFSKYTPDDIALFLNDYLIFEGDLREFVAGKNKNEKVTAEYFQRFSRHDLKESIVALYRMFSRLFYRV